MLLERISPTAPTQQCHLQTQVMVAHLKTTPKETKRASPYADTPCPVLSPEHIGTHFPVEKIVSSPPLLSPFYEWMISGNPSAFIGVLATSWVFYRDMSVHDESGSTRYRPLFFARIFSDGMEPFNLQMTAEWFTVAKEYMHLPPLARCVHHIRGP